MVGFAVYSTLVKRVKSCKDEDPDRRLSIITSTSLHPIGMLAHYWILVNKYQPDILVTLESDLWWKSSLQF
jgi:hypothetical protein